MKVMVTAMGKEMDAEVDPRFGRAAYFLVVDQDKGEVVEAVDNASGRGAAQGAGVQAAETASRLGVECLLTGHCGPKAFSALSAAGIKVFTGAKGSIREALEQYAGGKLTEAGQADVQGHW